jgi:hypothetical protein
MCVLDIFYFSMRSLLTLRSPHRHTPTHNAAHARKPVTSTMIEKDWAAGDCQAISASQVVS